MPSTVQWNLKPDCLFFCVLYTALLFHGNCAFLQWGAHASGDFWIQKRQDFPFEKKRRESILCLWKPSVKTVHYLIQTQEGYLHSLCVAFLLSFLTQEWMDSCAQAARACSCSCFVCVANPVGLEQYVWINFYLLACTFIWFYSWIMCENISSLQDWNGW